MKPAPFAYADPETVDEVLDLLGEHGHDAAILAGGQSLVPDLNFRRVRPRLVIDLRRVDGLDSIEHAGGGVVAGATTGVLALAAAHPATGVAEAVSCIGHPQIRSRTTVGGCISLADPSAELPAVLAALDGTVTVRSKRGDRTLGWADWFTGARTTARRPDELVTEVRFDVPSGPSCWLEVARRPNDLPIVGLFVAVDQGRWRVAVAGVGDRPVRAHACEAALAGGDAAAATVALVAGLHPRSDDIASASHRRSIAASLLGRALGALTMDRAA